ncbi:hypothetical protein [Nocardioides dilutus]
MNFPSLRFPSLRLSTAVTLAALLLATTSAAYAAGLARGSVHTRHLKNDAVTSAKVRNQSLTDDDLAAGALQPGPTGAPGPGGTPGPVGPRGTARGTALVKSTALVERATGILEDATVTKLAVGYFCVDVPALPSYPVPGYNPLAEPWVASAFPYPGFVQIVTDVWLFPYTCDDNSWAVLVTGPTGDPLDSPFTLALL